MSEGNRFTPRQQRTRKTLLNNGSALLLTNLSDVRWLTGFSGTNAVVLLDSDRCELYTDGRYASQAARETHVDEVFVVQGQLIGCELLAARISPLSALQIQSDSLTVAQFETIHTISGDAELIKVPGMLSSLRASKDESEVSSIRQALEISERVMMEIVSHIDDNVTERELAAEIDYQQRLLGADASAFDTIVAFGGRAALPHARPANVKLDRHMCVLMDFGCVVGGYRSDITRTIFFGEPSEKFITCYTQVERALSAVTGCVKAGMSGGDLDQLARSVLGESGLSEWFVHSLGHGVGLEIHESPRISSHSDSVIQRDSVITLEPGVYIPDLFGIRIENMAYVTDNGCEVLNQSGTDLLIID